MWVFLSLFSSFFPAFVLFLFLPLSVERCCIALRHAETAAGSYCLSCPCSFSLLLPPGYRGMLIGQQTSQRRLHTVALYTSYVVFSCRELRLFVLPSLASPILSAPPLGGFLGPPPNQTNARPSNGQLTRRGVVTTLDQECQLLAPEGRCRLQVDQSVKRSGGKGGRRGAAVEKRENLHLEGRRNHNQPTSPPKKNKKKEYPNEKNKKKTNRKPLLSTSHNLVLARPIQRPTIRPDSEAKRQCNLSTTRSAIALVVYVAMDAG